VRGLKNTSELLGRLRLHVRPNSNPFEPSISSPGPVVVIHSVLDEMQILIFEDESKGRYFHNIVVPIKIPGQEETIQIVVS